MAEICRRHQIQIISDEIHCDLIFSGHQHTPIASLSPEVAEHTITLMAPSKTFNIAGLECSFAVIPNRDLRKQFGQARRGLMSTANLFGLTAARAAYQEGQNWLDELLVYLEGNRDYLVTTIREQMPEIHVQAPEATYLAWLDCRGLALPESPYTFFLKQARVAVNDGKSFGQGGDGFVRFNFGCPRAMVEEALESMHTALTQVEATSAAGASE
jgi:cysteine-S-conjugate beta-lyase